MTSDCCSKASEVAVPSLLLLSCRGLSVEAAAPSSDVSCSDNDVTISSDPSSWSSYCSWKNCFRIFTVYLLRLRDSYKRFIKTWIRTVSWITNPDFKRFVSYRGSRILTLKDSFRIVSHESSQFSKICRFYESYESLRILSTIARNESLKIKIRESGFVTTNLKDSYRGFVS